MSCSAQSRMSRLLLLVWVATGACSQDARSERQQPIAPEAPVATGDAAPRETGASGAAGALSPAFGNPQFDGGVVPIRDSCADGGCKQPEPRVPDDDGFTVAEGDCDDFAPLTNPGAYDVPGNGIDEDCDGADATSDACDDKLDLAERDPLLAARAIELCQVTTETSKQWGVISARWTTPDGVGEPGSPLMHGVLPSFGKAFLPRGGKSVLALSSGVARAPGQTGYTRNCSDEFPASSTQFPKGFAGTSSTCDVDDAATSVVDAVALEVELRIPTNASALSFDSAFFTDEYPAYICTPYNDFFQVIVQPLRMGGTPDGNVVFDRDNNAVSVNNSFLGVCTPGQHGDKKFACPLGFEPIIGTGFEDCAFSLVSPDGLGSLFSRDEKYGASTGWLNTEFKVTPGEVITLRFTIWDSTDSALDSLALIDHVQFRLRDAPPPPERPMTMPIGPQ
jgi:hypothetical protein